MNEEGPSVSKENTDRDSDHKGETAKRVLDEVSSGQVLNTAGKMKEYFSVFEHGDVSCELLRPRLQTESVSNGRGRSIVRNFTFRKFGERPRAVLFISWPTGSGGGSFEPTDRLLSSGEPLQLSYFAAGPGGEKPIYFLAKAYFLRRSFYIQKNPLDSTKPWVGSREEAKKSLSNNVYVQGEDIAEVRVDTLTCMPNGPAFISKEIIERYCWDPKLFCIPGGGGWSQRSNQGDYFKSIRDPLEKYITKDGGKIIEKFGIDQMGNLGNVELVIEENLLTDIDDDALHGIVVDNPNEHLQTINAKVGFLLYFRIDDKVAKSLMKLFDKKVGKEDEVYLPLFLDGLKKTAKGFRVMFRVFPRDLIENRSSRRIDHGLNFMPPHNLHPGSQNQNTYSKLLIVVNQCFQEDEKSEEDKNKSEKLVSSVQHRIAEQQNKFTDEKLRNAFQERVVAKKRKDN
ncbi:MAG: hypothetical protein VX294_07945 [Candidatus Latescibacterota bacterium]|nr:hypothetical protein [Candidatus Latescibacterota bacterium]